MGESVPAMRRSRKYSDNGWSSVTIGPVPANLVTVGPEIHVRSWILVIQPSTVFSGLSYALEMSARTPGRSSTLRIAAGSKAIGSSDPSM